MDAVVVILSIFSLISAGVIAFLINDRRTQDKTFKLGDELEKKLQAQLNQYMRKEKKISKKPQKKTLRM